MRIISIFFLLLTLLAFQGTDNNLLAHQLNSPQARFDSANVLLENGDLTSAQRLYRDIEQSGFESGALYLNMGITAMQLDSAGLAKYYFLKSARFSETEDKALQALEFTESQFSRQSATLPELPWDRAITWLNNGPGPAVVFYTGFIILIAALILLLLMWFRNLIFPKQKWVIPGLFTAGILVILLAFYTDYIDRRYQEAVVIQKESRVYEQASAESSLVSMAYEGYDCTVDLKQSYAQNGWYYIRLGNGQYGWIHPESLKVL